MTEPMTSEGALAVHLLAALSLGILLRERRRGATEAALAAAWAPTLASAGGVYAKLSLPSPSAAIGRMGASVGLSLPARPLLAAVLCLSAVLGWALEDQRERRREW